MSSREKMVMFDPDTEELKTIPSSDSSEEDGNSGGIGISGGSREQDIRADIHGQIERMKALCPEEDDYGIISPTFGSPRDMSYLETREKYLDIKKKLEQSVNSRPKYSQDFEGDCGKSDVDSILESFQEFHELNQSTSSFIKYENHPKFLEMYQRIVERDHKILDLETKNMELDRQIIDLQDTVNQRDKIINSKNEAVQVVQTKMKKELDEKDFDLKRVEKTLFDMEKNFGNAQDCWGKEKDRLNKELHECRNKITHFENTNKSFEATRFELNAKNAELQEQIVSMQEENDKKLEVVNVELEGLKASLSKSNSNIGKLKTQYQAKLKALKEKYQPFETQVVELEQKLSILEEEKGNLLLKLIDLEKSEEIEQKNQKLEEEMKNLIEVKDTLESKILELESTIENNEFEGKETLESRINELNLIIQNKDLDLQIAIQQYEEICSKTETSNVISSNQFIEINQQLHDKNEEFNMVVSSLNEKENYILQLNDEVSNLKNQLHNFENMNQQISQELELKDMEIRNLREDSNCLQNDYSESSNDLKSKISSLMNQLNDYEREISVLTQRLNESAESKPFETTQSAFELNTKNPDLELQLQEQIIQVQEESDRKLESANAEIEELKASLTKSNANIGRLKAQYMTKLKALKEKYEQEISVQKPKESDENRIEEKPVDVSQSQGGAIENELASKSEEIIKLQESIRSIQDTFNHQANENYTKYAEDVNHLYSQLSFKTEENEQLQARINELQENINSNSTSALGADQQLIEKSNVILELEDKLLISQNRLEEVSISKDLTESDLQSAYGEIEDLKNSLTKSNSILEELKGKYQAKLKAFKEKYQPFESKVVELEQKLAEIENEKANTISLTEQFEEIKLEDQQQQSEASKNFGAESENVQILEKELADKSEEILKLQESLNSIQEKYELEANENYTKYAEDVNTLYTQLGLKSEENSQLQGRINELQESMNRVSQDFNSKSEHELMEKFNMIVELEEKLTIAQNIQDELSISKKLTENDLQNANAEIEDLKNSLTKSNGILEELKIKYQAKLKAFKEKYQPFENKVAELEQNLSINETEKAKVMLEFEELKIKNQQLEEMKKLILEREENPGNDENYQILEKELASKSEEIQRLQDTYNQQANENYAKYAEDVTNLYNQLSFKTEENGQLQGQINELNEHINTFTKSMQEATDKHLLEKSAMIKELEEKLLIAQNKQDELSISKNLNETDLQNANAEIEDLKNSLTKSNAILEELKVKYSAKLKSIKEKYQPFEAQVVEMAQKLSEFENMANQASLAEYEEIKLRNQHIDEELKSLSVVKEMCESKINDLELIIESKDRELQTALQQYQEMYTKAENSDFINNQVNELSQQLSEKNHEFNNIISSLNEKESYILQVNDELNNVRNQLNYLETTNQNITQQLEFKDEELKNIQREHVKVKDGLESKISTLMDQFNSMEQETLVITTKLKESEENLRQNLEGTGDRIQILEKELEDKCEEIVKLSESIRSAQENYNFEANANYAKYSEDMNTLYNQLNFQTGENAQLQSRLNELQEQTAAFSTSMQDSVQEQLKDKSNLIKELEDKFLTAQNQLDEFSISKEFTESDLQNANAEIEDLKNSLTRSNGILEELKMQYQIKLDHVRESYQPYEARVAELENKLVEIETERNNLLTSLQHIQQQYSTSTGLTSASGQIQEETLVGAGASSTEDPNEKVKALTAELKTLKIKNGKMLQKFKQLDTEHKKLKAKSEISLDASFEEEFMSQFKVKEEELNEKSKLLSDLQSDYGKLIEKADLFERSNAKLIEMKEYQDKYIDQLVNEKKILEGEISGLKWRLEESESASTTLVEGQGQQQQFIELQQQSAPVSDIPSQIQQQQQASILTTDQLNEIQTLRKHNELLSNELLELQDEITRLSQEKGFTVEEERVHIQPTGELISTERPSSLTSEEARAWALLDAERIKSSILEKKIDLLHNKISEIELSEIKCFEESINLKSLTRQLEMENFKYQREIEAYGGRGEGGSGDAKSRILNSEIFRLVEALQDRDKRCEELTAEITRLLEERDTLQLKLSNVLKKNVHLSEELKKIGGDLYKDNDENSTKDAENPIYDKEELRMKLAELEQINYSINIDLRREKEARRIVQEQLFFSQSSRIYQDRFRDVSRRTPSPSFSAAPSPSKVPITPQSQQVQAQKQVIPATPSFIPTINPDPPVASIASVPWSGETFEFDQSLSVQTGHHQSSQQRQHSPNPNLTSIPVVDI